MKLKQYISSFLQLFFPVFRKFIPFDLYAYITLGGINTVFNILIFILFYELILSKDGILLYKYRIESYTISLLIAFFATIPTGFWLAKHFAFNKRKKEGDIPKQIIKYFLVVIQGLITDYLLLILLILSVGFHPTIAKITTTVVVVLINFLLQKYFTFRLGVT